MRWDQASGGHVATVISPQAYMSDCKVRKASFYTLFIAMGREDVHFVGWVFNGSKRNRKV